MANGTAFTATLTNNDNGWGGACIRQIFPAGSLTAPSGAITQLRLKLNPSTIEAFGISAIYIGHKATSGNAYDYTGGVQLTVGSSGSFVLAANTPQYTDWCNFVWDKTKDIVIAFDCSGTGGANDSCRSLNGTAITNYYKTATAEAASGAASSGYTNGGIGTLDLISDIEMDGYSSGGGSGYQPTLVTAGAGRTTVRRQVNTAESLYSSATEMDKFRVSFYTADDAVAYLDFQTDLVHNEVSGYSGVLACGLNLIMREGTTELDMQGATLSVIDPAITGGNIYDRVAHYCTLSRRAAVPLQGGKFYQFGAILLATRPGSTTSGQASLLVEGGNGLNSFIVTVDKTATLTLA